MVRLFGILKCLLPAALIAIPHTGIGQIGKDSTLTISGFEKINKRTINPRLATRLALIPGAGQIYNGDYWKVPIVYLGLAGGIYSYHLNSLKYHDFLKAYESFFDPATGNLAEGVTLETKRAVLVRNLFNTASMLDSARKDPIEKQKNYWRRNRNLSLIATGLIYTLSIIEANVTAHMKTSDLSDDLTMNISPKISQPLVRQPLVRQPTPGLSFVFNFK